MAAAVEEDVLGLEVAVDDAAAVEVGQRRHDLRRVEPHARHREAALLPAQGECKDRDILVGEMFVTFLRW